MKHVQIHLLAFVEFSKTLCLKHFIFKGFNCTKQWFHYECVPLTEEEFPRQGGNKLRDFFCGRCVLLQLPTTS